MKRADEKFLKEALIYPGHPSVLALLICLRYKGRLDEALVPSPNGSTASALEDSAIPGAGDTVRKALDLVADVRSGKLRPFEAEKQGYEYWEDHTNNKDAIPVGRAQAAKFRKRIMKALDDIYDSKSEWLDFGEVAHGMCGMQSQYCSRYVDGFDCPNFGQGLRIVGRCEDYHFLRVHRDDAAEFARRVNDYRREKGMIA